MWYAITVFNESRVAWAMAVLITNIGAKYLTLHIDAHEVLFQSLLFKYLIILCLMFVTTRDILLSVSITTVVVAFISTKGRLCITPSCYINHLLFDRDDRDGASDDSDDDDQSEATDL